MNKLHTTWHGTFITSPKVDENLRAIQIVTQKTCLEQPDLLSPEHPVLYKAVTHLLVDNQRGDDYYTSFGIRWFEFASAFPTRKEDYKEFEESCITTLKEMIRTNRNHPSIIDGLMPPQM